MPPLRLTDVCVLPGSLWAATPRMTIPPRLLLTEFRRGPATTYALVGSAISHPPSQPPVNRLWCAGPDGDEGRPGDSPASEDLRIVEAKRVHSETPVFQTLARHGFLTASQIMAPILEHAIHFAEREVSVLLTGETGTGKEVLAKAIHEIRSEGPGHKGPFVAINCSAIPETLLEGLLFGHRRGAFTDAIRDQEGLIEGAKGGTLFLDEIGELPFGVQAKLLRVLDTRKLTRIGDTTERLVDFQLITATNRPLRNDAGAGRFRKDLFYRINVAPIHLPPLRERRDDILLLTCHFVTKYLQKERQGRTVPLTPGFLDRLLSHEWPGNIRELRNVIERSMVLRKGDELGEADLPPEILSPKTTNDPAPPEGEHEILARLLSDPSGFDHLYRRAIEVAIKMAKGNLVAAARIMRTTPRKLLNEIGRLGLSLDNP